MRRSLIAVSAVLLVFVTVLGGGAVLSSSESGDVNQQSPITPEVGGNGPQLREASAALRSARLGSLGVPLAGVYVDEGTATIHVGLTEIADEYTAPIEAIVEQVEGVNVEFFQARFTLPELGRLLVRVEQYFLGVSSADMARLFCVEDPEDRDELRSEFQSETEHRVAEHGVPLTLVGVDIRGNGLVIGLTEVTPEYVAAIREVVGDEVSIEFVEGEVNLDRTGKHRPLLGGIQLATNPGYTTLSFPATAGGESGFVMTGHAGDVGDRVWQPTRWLWNRVGTISADPPGPRFSDAAFVPNGYTDPLVWPDRDIVGWSASYETDVGTIVNMEGITTDGTQGVIAFLHITFASWPYLYNQVLATYESDYGDSGAPTFLEDTPGHATIVGTHVGAVGDYAVYSPVEGIAFDLGLDGITLQGVTGLVGDSYSGWPLQGAEVWDDGTGSVVFSDATGRYTIPLAPGIYNLTASYPTFYEETGTVQVVSGQFATLNFALDPICPGCPIPMGTGEPPGVTAAPQ